MIVYAQVLTRSGWPILTTRIGAVNTESIGPDLFAKIPGVGLKKILSSGLVQLSSEEFSEYKSAR